VPSLFRIVSEMGGDPARHANELRRNREARGHNGRAGVAEAAPAPRQLSTRSASIAIAITDAGNPDFDFDLKGQMKGLG
jgi:hypothetical protein